MSNRFKKILISTADVTRIKEHRKLYCSCTEAAIHIGCQDRYFLHIMKIRGMPPVPADESGVDTIILVRWSDVRREESFPKVNQISP